ncbi:protein RCC2 [Dromaius novaehollandiae]|uniref:protein RCC2 n=1 Tax=Dromaius novaehollandiae TaxID=8790 RepID=UPI00311EEC20
MPRRGNGSNEDAQRGNTTKNIAKAPSCGLALCCTLRPKNQARAPPAGGVPAMPRRKATAAPWEPGAGNGTAPRQRGGPAAAGGRRRPRPERGGGSSGGSSDEEAPRERRPRAGSPGGGGGGGAAGRRPPRAGPPGPPGGPARGQAVVICEPEHSKERVKLEGSKCRGQLLIFGATNWDLIGRKEVPKQQVAYRNLGQNLWGPHRYGCLAGIRVRTVVSGPCAAHSLLITAEGKLWSWGRNEKGQLGHGDSKRVEAPRLVEALGGEAVVLAACGRNHTLALTESGSVFAFGENKMGQLGLGNQTDAVPSPTQIMYNGQPITKLACGAEFSMIMDCKGNLYSFGCPEYGQLGHNSDGKFIARAQRIEYDCELLPRRVAIFVEKTKDGQVLPVPNVVVRDVACGANHTLVLDSQRRVFSWGFGGYGRLGHAEQKDEMVPRLVKLFDLPGRGAAQVYAGYTCSFAVSETGGLFFWGATNTSRESTMYPKAVQDLCGWKIRSLACGKSSILVAADESTISWGPSPTFGELGYGDHKPKSSTAAQEVKTLDGIYTEQVAMGYAHSLVIARDESEGEKERLKKLPEYNPRTL